MIIPAWERVLRVLLGLVVFSAMFLLSGPSRFLGILGLVPLYTGLIGWCPIRSRRHRRRHFSYRRRGLT